MIWKMFYQTKNFLNLTEEESTHEQLSKVKKLEKEIKKLDRAVDVDT